MNVVPHNTIVVVEISNSKIIVKVSGYKNKKELLSEGFENLNEFLISDYNDENQKMKIIHILVQRDALFSFGYGWSPSEIMAYYKEEGIYKGNYKKILWRSSTEYVIEEQ
ncbi:hypothetical protein [Celerinatantimonas sp. YJH-8]|uniref:hypothetical protein n=1 Tax=Celerinatantimonas sp. YJH-8 TaxID=3228714 RepID=UPI0038C84DD7